MLVVIASVTVLLLSSCSSEKKTALQMAQPPRNQGGILQVTGRRVEYRVLENKIFATGTIIANEEVELRSEINSRVLSIRFREGSFVSKNDLLVKLDDLELQAQLKRSEFRLELAIDREIRQRKLYDEKLLSEEEYNIALNELNVFRSEVEILKAQLIKTEIRAPFSGAVGLRYVSEGSFITPNTRISTLQNLDHVKIDFAIPEKYSTQIRRGDKIHFRIAGSERRFEGTVFAIEPKIDASTRTVALRAIASNPANMLFPGAFAEIELSLSETQNAILIPAEALVQDLQGQKVFIMKSGKAQSRVVKTDLRTDKEIQIIDGLSAGDTVFTSGVLQLRDNLPVEITRFN